MKSIAFFLIMFACGWVDAAEDNFIANYMANLDSMDLYNLCYEREMQYLSGNSDLYGLTGLAWNARGAKENDQDCLDGYADAIKDFSKKSGLPD